MIPKEFSDIEDLVNRKVILYDHKAKSSDFKFGKEFKLETIGLEEMPDYIKNFGNGPSRMKKNTVAFGTPRDKASNNSNN